MSNSELSDISISYDWDSSDLPPGRTVTEMWNQATNYPEKPSGMQLDANLFSPPISAGPNGIAYELAYSIAYVMKISFTRMYDVKLTPTFAADNVTVLNLHFSASINNTVSKSSAQPNDNISALCAGNWYIDIIKNNRDPNTPKPVCTTPDVVATFTSDIPNKFEHATNVDSSINLASELIENATNVTLTILPSKSDTSSNGSPIFLADYVFQYSFLISFMGASFFGISSIIAVDPTTIIANKNVSVALNVLIGLAGFISLYVWFNKSVPVLDNSIINSSSVKKIN